MEKSIKNGKFSIGIVGLIIWTILWSLFILVIIPGLILSEITSNAAIKEIPSVEFEMNGPSLEEVAKKDPIGTYYALQAMHNVQTNAVRLNLKGRQFEQFRHVYFSALLTKEIGEVRCQKFTDAYERFIPNPKTARDYDLKNNELGRMIGKAQEGLSDYQLQNYILYNIILKKK